MRCNQAGLNRVVLIAVCCGLLAFGGRKFAAAHAQEQDEAAMADDADALPVDDEAADAKPKPAPKSKSPAKPGKSAAGAESAVPQDPAVLAILESHPETSAELLRAIQILVDLDQANLAKPFVDELATRKLDLAAKAALANQFNSAILLKLAHNAELGQVLAPFVDDLFTSAESYRRDAKRLAAWARQLGDKDETVRAQAALSLLRAREAAVAPLVEILSDPTRAAERAAATNILVQLDEVAIAPLLGVLESSDAALKSRVVEVLGTLRAQQAVAFLLGPLLSPESGTELRAAAATALEKISGHAPTPGEALRLLEHAARRPLERSRLDDDPAAAPKEVWHWNARRKQSMPISYDPTGASLATAAHLARDLYRLDTTHAGHRRLYLTALLQAAKFRAGLDKPLATGAGTAYAVAAHQGVDVVEDLLADAMAHGYLPAATAAAQILGDTGSAALLQRSGSTPSSLALAAQHADRRLRFAALEAILKFKPTEPFAGSSRVTDGLAYFASSYGVPRVLIAHGRSEEAQKLAGLAGQLGYEADIATNGRRAFELAVNSPDYEFALIHSAIERPPADELLAQLRRDRRTALLPVGFIAPLDDLERIQRFAEMSSRADAFLQPQNEPEMKLFSQRVLARAGRAHVSPAERRAQAIAALDGLIALSQGPQRVFDVRRQEPALAPLLYVPELSTRAAAVLGQLGTVKSQRSLLELADLSTQPLPTRQAAVTAFAHSVRQHGIALTREELLQQYDLYNANAGRDVDTNAVLSAILDTIEHRGRSTADE